MRTLEQRETRKKEVMNNCVECFCEHGLNGTNMKMLANYSDMSQGNLYVYFDTLDDLILECTAYCMQKVEEDFVSIAPTSLKDIYRFLDEAPAWSLKKHGKKYRFMYQVYTSPKYYAQGKKFYEGLNSRHDEYSKQLAAKIGIPPQKLLPLVLMAVRAIVHYALFEDKAYLVKETDFLKGALDDLSAK